MIDDDKENICASLFGDMLQQCWMWDLPPFSTVLSEPLNAQGTRDPTLAMQASMRAHRGSMLKQR